MTAMPSNITTTPQPPTLFTVPEAAWASQTTNKFINGEVDKNIVKVARTGKRLLADWDVVYFAAMCDIASSVSVELRRDVYNAVRTACEHQNHSDLKFGAFLLRLRGLLAQTHKRTANITAARDAVEINPKVRGGDPVIRGTRLSVHLVAEIARSGASKEELTASYPLTLHQVEMAILYDEMHPKRGRPSKQAKENEFIDLGDMHRDDVEELGVYTEP